MTTVKWRLMPRSRTCVLSVLLTHPVDASYRRCFLELLRASVRARGVELCPTLWLSIVHIHYRLRVGRGQSAELLGDVGTLSEILIISEMIRAGKGLRH